MYRRAAAQGPLHGVAGGPYTGKARHIDATKLPAAAQKRLADALAGRGEPSPIAIDRSLRLPSSLRAGWGAVAGVVVLVATFAAGFDDPTSRWELQPQGALLVYLLGAALASASLLALVRRRALAFGSQLRPGRYLLPLDVVEVAPVDARGRQIVRVVPLGDARDAVIDRARVSLVFEDTSRIAFPLRADPGGAVTRRRLEHAQRLLEELTYAGSLEAALASDPFFELRVDGSWASAAPSDDAAPPSLRTKRSLSAGRTGTAIASASALAVAAGAFVARDALGDRLAFERALREGTPEAFDVYLAKGKRHRGAAEAGRAFLLAAREAPPPKPPPDRPLPPAAPTSCLEALRARASPAHPEVPRLMEAIVARAREDRDVTVPLRFERRVAAGSDLALEERFAARERVFAWAFERVFSESCPASVIRFRVPADAAPGGEPFGLFVRYSVSETARTWRVPRRDARSEIELRGLEIVFDVRLEAPAGKGRETFRLTMPPPDRPSMALRTRSIFTGDLVDDGTFDERAYDAMAARAFDRLYDEVYGLFFAGDPRVPLRTTEGVDDF